MRCLWQCLLWFFAAPVWAVESQDLQFQDTGYSVCKIDMRRDDIRLFLRGADGLPYGDFATLNAALEAQGQTLGFAMNAGMYHPDRRPVGYYVEEGAEYMRLLLRASVGILGCCRTVCYVSRTARSRWSKRFDLWPANKAVALPLNRGLCW